jgi:hypothetical protein
MGPGSVHGVAGGERHASPNCTRHRCPNFRPRTPSMRASTPPSATRAEARSRARRRLRAGSPRNSAAAATLTQYASLKGASRRGTHHRRQHGGATDTDQNSWDRVKSGTTEVTRDSGSCQSSAPEFAIRAWSAEFRGGRPRPRGHKRARPSHARRPRPLPSPARREHSTA